MTSDQALAKLVGRLEEQGVPYMVVGALSANFSTASGPKRGRDRRYRPSPSTESPSG